MKFISIQVLEDNFMYLFYDDKIAFCIDPIEPNTIDWALHCKFAKQNYHNSEITKLKKVINRRKLLYSFTTHSHYDHSCGDQEIKNLNPEVKQISGFSSNPCKDMEVIDIDEKIKVLCIATPCHTKDSFCFYVDSKYLCTGDTIFFLGCGKFFDGNASDMIDAIDKIKNNVGGETLLLYGHDYRISDISFAEKYLKVPYEIKSKLFLTLEEEIKYNPFFYADEDDSNRIKVIKERREKKNAM